MNEPAKQRPKSILITGASSGIGEALALEYAAAGVRLALGGRSEKRLGRVADACRAKAATVDPIALDVADEHAMRQRIERVDSQAPLDLVIAQCRHIRRYVGRWRGGRTSSPYLRYQYHRYPQHRAAGDTRHAKPRRRPDCGHEFGGILPGFPRRPGLQRQ